MCRKTMTIIFITVGGAKTHHGVKEVVSEKGDTTFVYKIATNPQIAKQLKRQFAADSR